MIRKLGIWAFSVASITAPAHASNYMDICAKALTFSDVSHSQDRVARLSYLETKLHSMSTSGRSGAVIDIPGYGSGSYDQAQAEVNRLKQELALNWNIKEHQSYLARFVSPDSNSTFAQCVSQVLSQNAPLSLVIEQATDDQIMVSVRIGSNPLATSGIRLEINSDGEFIDGVQRTWTMAGGITRAIIRRRDPGKPLNISARAVSKGTELGNDLLMIPPIIVVATREERREVRSASSDASCGGQEGSAREGWGNEVQVTAGPDEYLDLNSYEEVEVRNHGSEHRAAQKMASHGARMRNISKSTQRISGAAWCSIYAHETFYYSAAIKAIVVKSITTVTASPSNGVPLRMARAPDTPS